MPKIENWSANHENASLKKDWTHDKYNVHVGILQKEDFKTGEIQYYRVYFEDSDLVVSDTIAETDTLEEAEDIATEWMRNHPLHDYNPSFEEKVRKGSTGHLTDEEEEMVKEELNWVVIDARDRDMSWGESYLGTGLGTTTDYGRHHDMTEEELIEKNKDSLGFTQYTNFQTPDGEVADTVAIISKRNGYVRKPAKLEDLKEKGLV